MNIQTGEHAVGTIVGNRSPVLLFDVHEDPAQLTGLAGDRLLEGFELLLPRQRQNRMRAITRGAPNAFYQAWQDLETQHNSCSIGLIAASSHGADAVARIISDGAAGGPLPGAIALTRFSALFFELCRQMAERLPEPRFSVGPWSCVPSNAAPFEWPPMVVLLPDGDPEVLACARACRGLRANGVPICLEILPSLDWADGGSLPEFFQELGRFFAAHLMPVFPKLL